MMRQIWTASMAVAVGLVVTGCMAQPGAELGVAEAPLVEPGRMQVYVPGRPVPQTELMVVTPPGGLGPGGEMMGGTVLEGSLEVAVRVDYSSNGITAGIFQASRAKVQIVFPFTEHATILHGKVRITDETGQTHLFEEGDSYVIKQGSVVLWDVTTPYVQKSFFNLSEPQ